MSSPIPESWRPTLAPETPPKETLLRLRQVTAGYGAGLILKGVDLTASRGEIICLIGPNGAGKSTVLKTISGLLRHRDGSILFAGEDIGTLSSRQRLDRGSKPGDDRHDGAAHPPAPRRRRHVPDR